MTAMASKIEEKLRAAFAPVSLHLENQSHLHAGHAGSPGTGDSHFRLVIVSEAFDGESRVARQRAINTVLKEELAGPVHALSIDARSPAETA